MIGRVCSPAQALALILFFAACAAKPLYDGPVRAANEIAALTVQGTRLFKVDSKAAEEGSKTVTILPGPHAVSVFLADGFQGGGPGRRFSREPLAACFEARAAGAYRVRPVYGRTDWWPEVVDEASGTAVSTRVVDGIRPNCAPAPASAVAAGETTRAPPAAADEEAPAAPAAVHPVSLVRIDRGGIADRLPRPTVTLRFGTGLTIGGERIARATLSNGQTEDLRAGDGLHLTMGMSWTPLWLADSAGFGVGADAGLKIAWIGASNGHIYLFSLPTIASLHTILPVTTKWSMLARAGVEKDFAAQITGDGDVAGAKVSLSSKLGFMGELGPTYRQTNRGGFGIVARFTWIQYAVGGATIDAWNAGAMIWGTYDVVTSR